MLKIRTAWLRHATRHTNTFFGFEFVSLCRDTVTRKMGVHTVLPEGPEVVREPHTRR